LIPEDDRFLHNQRLGLIQIIDAQKLDKNFLYYVLNNESYRAQVRGSATGVTVRHTAPERIYRCRVKLPPLPLQRVIGETLKNYDDLIANNRRRIELLEQSAQELFKEWFVRLRYPGHEHDKAVNGVPKGWKKIIIDGLVEIQSGFAFKSSTYVQGGLFKVVTIKNVQDGHFDDQCDSLLQEIPRKMPAHCTLTEGDILLSLTGNIGRVCIVHGENFVLNQRVSKLVPRDVSHKSFVYFFFRDANTRKRLEGISAGVAQQNLSPIAMGALEIMLPTSDLIGDFSDFCFPIIEQTIALTNMNSKLLRSRDLLLPRVMDGRIAI
jgi:type I restriction enzyme, S subunit